MKAFLPHSSVASESCILQILRLGGREKGKEERRVKNWPFRWDFEALWGGEDRMRETETQRVGGDVGGACFGLAGVIG
jgi:hypothetical protein